MWLCYHVFSIYQLLEIIIIVTNRPTQGRQTVLSRLSGSGALSLWFWWMVMYFAPYDDAALAFLMECVRLCCACLFRMFDCDDDPIINQITSTIEVSHWFITLLCGCHYPIVLWYRVPLLLNVTRVGACRLWMFATTKSGDSTRWLLSSKTAVRKRCVVWHPVRTTTTTNPYNESAMYERPMTMEPHDRFAGGRIPGLWRKTIKTVWLTVDENCAEMECPGGMRNVYRAHDQAGNIFTPEDGLAQELVMSHLNEFIDCNVLNKHHLLIKEFKPDQFEELSIEARVDRMFRECHQQLKCQEYAEKFNAKCHTCHGPGGPGLPFSLGFIPTAIVCFVNDNDDNDDEAPEEKCENFRFIECNMKGKFLKWNANEQFRDVVNKVDVAPGAFSHFTWHESRGEEIVVDMQGVSTSKYQRKYLFTDPQLHSHIITDPSARISVGDLGKNGMIHFYQGHRCTQECRALELDTVPMPYLKDSQEAKNWKRNFQKADKKKHDVELIDELIIKKTKELQMLGGFWLVATVLTWLLWLEYPEKFDL